MYVAQWAPVQEAPAALHYNLLLSTHNMPLREQVNLVEQKYTWLIEHIGKVPNREPGQGTSNPLAVFSDHALVKLTVAGTPLLFDPSYGKEYTSLQSFQNTALSYLGTLALVRRTLNGIVWRVRFQPLSNDTPLQLIEIQLKR